VSADRDHDRGLTLLVCSNSLCAFFGLWFALFTSYVMVVTAFAIDMHHIRNSTPGTQHHS
jgi:hypothetical protein